MFGLRIMNSCSLLYLGHVINFVISENSYCKVLYAYEELDSAFDILSEQRVVHSRSRFTITYKLKKFRERHCGPPILPFGYWCFLSWE